MAERRTAARKKSFLQGRVYYNHHRSSLDCLVRDISEEGARLVPYNPIEDYGYPLESWPKDTKDPFVSQHKDDPVADIGTARLQPKRQPVSFTQEREGTEDHFLNLFECMRTRKQPVENVDFGCGTAVACHMANLSYRDGGKRLTWDRQQNKVVARG